MTTTQEFTQWLKARDTTTAQFATILTKAGIPTTTNAVENWRSRKVPRWASVLLKYMDALAEIETAINNARLAHGRNAQATVAQELERAANACAKMKTE